MTREDLEEFIELWEESGSRYMVIICDTFDYEDYPVFCDAEECQEKIDNPGTMQRVMEVYDNQVDLDIQREEDRAWYPPEASDDED